MARVGTGDRNWGISVRRPAGDSLPIVGNGGGSLPSFGIGLLASFLFVEPFHKIVVNKAIVCKWIGTTITSLGIKGGTDGRSVQDLVGFSCSTL